MMPLALGMLWVELWLLSRLLLEPEPEGTPTMRFVARARTEKTIRPLPVTSSSSA
jgi:hypothetical protein